MMSANQKTLLAIAAFVALCIGSFIWFIATWDATREEPVSRAGSPSHLLAKNIPGAWGLAPTPTPTTHGAPA